MPIPQNVLGERYDYQEAPCIKVLSIQQPWAALIITGIKDCENREWSTGYKGDFYIHASKKVDSVGMRFVESQGIVLPEAALLTGGIVGKAYLTKCRTDMHRLGNKWAMAGFFQFMLKDAVLLEFFPCRGKLFWFDVPEGFTEKKGVL